MTSHPTDRPLSHYVKNRPPPTAPTGSTLAGLLLPAPDAHRSSGRSSCSRSQLQPPPTLALHADRHCGCTTSTLAPERHFPNIPAPETKGRQSYFPLLMEIIGVACLVFWSTVSIWTMLASAGKKIWIYLCQQKKPSSVSLQVIHTSHLFSLHSYPQPGCTLPFP